MNTQIKQLAGSLILVRVLDDYIKKWHTQAAHRGNNILFKLHYINFKLWHEENKSRIANATDKQLAEVKKNIDILNATRNKLVRQINMKIYAGLRRQNKSLPWNSESPAGIFDRLSILSLRFYHSNLKAKTNKNYLKTSDLLRQERDDLASALRQLMDDLVNGRKQFKLPMCAKLYDGSDV